ncbi:MAG: hypothetical protein Kow00124_09150 [Anaerolineae bacterium]
MPIARLNPAVDSTIPVGEVKNMDGPTPIIPINTAVASATATTPHSFINLSRSDDDSVTNTLVNPRNATSRYTSWITATMLFGCAPPTSVANRLATKISHIGTIKGKRRLFPVNLLFARAYRINNTSAKSTTFRFDGNVHRSSGSRHKIRKESQ